MAMTNPDPWAPGRIDRVLMVVCLVGFLALLGAYVALKLAHEDPSDLIRLFANLFGVGTVGAGLSLRMGTLSKRMTRIEQGTQQIQQQTNGNLDRRIRDLSYESLRRALVDHTDEPTDTDSPSS